jgi:hypothetical protein
MTQKIFETPNDTNAIGIAENVKIAEGALIGRNSNGFGRAIESSDMPVGFAMDEVDNIGGENGQKSVDVRAVGKVVLEIQGVNETSVGGKVYATANDEFTLSETDIYIGTLVRCDKENSGIVAFNFLNAEQVIPAESEQPEETQGE